MRTARTLLSHAIDYAGVFPPASLAMADAVRNYNRYREGGDAWALGNFVLPLASLNEFEAAAAGLGLEQPIPLSVVLPSPEFDRSALSAGLAFGSIVSAEVRITEIEQAGEVASLAPPGITNYFEIPPAHDRMDLLDAIASEGERAKLRTGGVQPGSIPAPVDVVNFLSECRRARVAFKATAGLHHAIRGAHPLTYEPGALVEVMHGFLNLLLAAAIIFVGGEADEALSIIEEENAAAFRFAEDSVEVHRRKLTDEELRYVREQFAISFGSCSFEEPLKDLRHFGLI